MNHPLKELIRDASAFLKDEFRLQIERSQLKTYSEKQWQLFCATNSFNPESGGMYIPLSLIAYVREESPYIISDIFHEYHGHGLFCEHSRLGTTLVSLVQNRSDPSGFLQEQHRIPETESGLRTVDVYEGFAVWLEALLCQETGNKIIWEKKRQTLLKKYNVLFEQFHDIEKSLSRKEVMRIAGFYG